MTAAAALALGLALGAGAQRPTNAALRKAYENNQRALVEVKGPHRSGACRNTGTASAVARTEGAAAIQAAAAAARTTVT